MKLVLHIGLHKTGSSALQYAFAKQREALSAEGVHYAVTGKQEAVAEEKLLTSGNGSILGLYLRPQKQARQFAAEAFERTFEERYISPNHPISLISSESLAAADEAMLVRFRDHIAKGHELLVVAFVRDIYGHALSSWMQKIKGAGHVNNFGRHAAKYDNAQVERLRMFHRVLGSDRFKVVHYDSHKTDLFGAFFDAVGLKNLKVEAPRERINRSLTLAETEVLRDVNRLTRGGGDEIGKFLARGLLYKAPDREKGFILLPKVVADFEARFADDIAWVNDTFFGGKPVLKVIEADAAGDAKPKRGAREEVLNDVVALLVERLAERENDQARFEAERLLLKAQMYKEKDKAKEAIATLRKLLQIDPDHKRAQGLLTRLTTGEDKKQAREARRSARAEALAKRGTQNERRRPGQEGSGDDASARVRTPVKRKSDKV